jgi:ubiquinone/menaquinone biosynthesis C-methylase UbiE
MFVRRDVQQLFSERAATFDQGNWATDSALLSAHIALTRPLSPRLVLDAACGTGVLGGELARRGTTVIGVDICREMLDRAAKRLNLCVLSDIARLPFRSGAFDLVVCRQGLTYVQPERGLSELRRVVRAGGNLLISLITPYSEADYDWFERRCKIKKPKQTWVPSVDSLDRLAQNAGLVALHRSAATTFSLLSRSASRTSYERSINDILYEHYLSAPEHVKQLYNMKFADHDVTYTINWIIVLYTHQ